MKFNLPIVNHSLQYNPSLDGIRGIAILSVLFFHIWPQYFYYGFLGVDLFFVLSGYLITNIIYTKLNKGSFSFKEFYRNRVRRIFPAVIVVLLFTLFIGWLFLFPSELKDLGHHIKSSAFFYQNFRLINEVGYWDKAAQLKPLLHFWSLSVEEQFYIFWPFVIFVIYKKRFNLITSLFVLLIFSFSLKYFIDMDTFYNSLARFWELVLGAFLFAIGSKYSYEISKTNLIFSNKVLVFFGLISFPLYLWHYVIISYMYIFNLNVEKYALVIIFSSVLLAYLTYRYIELYARQQKSYRFAAILFILLFSIGMSGSYIYKHNGLPNRKHLKDNGNFKQQFIREVAQNKQGIKLVSEILHKKPINDYVKATTTNINAKFVAIVGDSHAHASYPGLKDIAKRHGYEALLLSNSSCPPYPDGAMGRNLKEVKECREKIDNIYTLLNDNLNIKKIIFITRATKNMLGNGFGIIDDQKPVAYTGAKFENYFTDKKHWNQKKEFLNNIEKLFKKYNNSKVKFYYIMEDPELGFDPKNCMMRPFDIFPSNCKIKLEAFLNRQKEYRTFVYKISKKYPNITILDPKNFYCDGKYCYAMKNGKMLYADDDHQSVDGSIMQAKYFENEIFNDK